MAKVDVISSCLVGMAKNGDAIASHRLELTPWDLQFLLFDPIQKGILFHKPESQQLQENLIHHLKSSLSRTLDFFPPLAGRFCTIKNGDSSTCYSVDCNNAGVEFTHAVARAVSVSDILAPKHIPEIVASFFPLNGIPNYEGVSKPLLGVQITELEDGFFIACTANHSIIDGTSFWHFFNSWSEISRETDAGISKIPVFDRWYPASIADKNRLVYLPPFEQNLLQPNIVPPPPLLERVFHFSKESVAKLKAKANSEANTQRISSLQAFSAHLWRAVVRSRLQNLRNPDNGDNVDTMLLVGARARNCLPDGYFGNAIYGARISTSESEILQHGLGYVALKLNELVTQQTPESSAKFVEEWVKNPTLWRKGRSTFAMSSSPRHNVYGTDFGWGKPVAVRSGKGQKFDGKMTVFPASEPGGIDVEACLAPQTLLAMGDDAEFMEAVTV